jgi:hypothetical protein
MKRVVLAVLLVLGLGVAAFGSGPLINFGIEPAAGASVSLGFGWDFDSWAIIGAKSGFNTWEGAWSISALWTPDVGFADVRVGPKLELNMYALAAGAGTGTTPGNHPAGLSYKDMAIILGIEHFWGIVGAYGQLEIGATGTFSPVIGLELHFDLPKPSTP